MGNQRQTEGSEDGGPSPCLVRVGKGTGGADLTRRHTGAGHTLKDPEKAPSVRDAGHGEPGDGLMSQPPGARNPGGPGGLLGGVLGRSPQNAQTTL